MNWYLEQKHAWDWKAMLPGAKKPEVIPPLPQTQKPKRNRQEVEADKSRWLMQMNWWSKGEGKIQPGAGEKFQEAKARYQAALDESSELHEVGFQPSKV